jgi:hypothetical protein
MAEIIIRRSPPAAEGETRQSYDMLVEVESASGVPKEIFVFQRGVRRLVAGALSDAPDEFVSVADPVDLEAYPADSPDPRAEMPYYRLSKVELRFRSLVDMEEVWNYIRQDVDGLMAALSAGVDPGGTERWKFTSGGCVEF